PRAASRAGWRRARPIRRRGPSRSCASERRWKPPIARAGWNARRRRGPRRSTVAVCRVASPRPSPRRGSVPRPWAAATPVVTTARRGRQRRCAAPAWPRRRAAHPRRAARRNPAAPRPRAVRRRRAARRAAAAATNARRRPGASGGEGGQRLGDAVAVVLEAGHALRLVAGGGLLAGPVHAVQLDHQVVAAARRGELGSIGAEG